MAVIAASPPTDRPPTETRLLSEADEGIEDSLLSCRLGGVFGHSTRRDSFISPLRFALRFAISIDSEAGKSSGEGCSLFRDLFFVAAKIEKNVLLAPFPSLPPPIVSIDLARRRTRKITTGRGGIYFVELPKTMLCSFPEKKEEGGRGEGARTK